MKKERSINWLRELKEWMDQDGNMLDSSTCNETVHSRGKSRTSSNPFRSIPIGKNHRHPPESKRRNSSEECSRKYSRTDNSHMDKVSHPHSQYKSQIDKLNTNLAKDDGSGVHNPNSEDMHSEQHTLVSNLHDGSYARPSTSTMLPSETPVYDVNPKRDLNATSTSLPVVSSNFDLQSSFISSGSPPHYQREILNRRLNLEEEILQLSAESFSVASSDTNTSCSKDDICDFGSSYSERAPIPDGYCSGNSYIAEDLDYTKFKG